MTPLLRLLFRRSGAQTNPDFARATAFDTSTRVLRDPDGSPTADERALLLAIYAEVAATWRDLHEVRFRLLAILPLVTVGAFALVAPAQTTTLGAVAMVIAAGLGAAVTKGLRVYDLRNSELYDDLISRGRRIEAELGLDHGVFRGRPAPRFAGVNHSTATRIIYDGVWWAWLFGLAAALINLTSHLVRLFGG